MRFQKLCWVALAALLAQNTLVQAGDSAVDKKNRTWGEWFQETGDAIMYGSKGKKTDPAFKMAKKRR